MATIGKTPDIQASSSKVTYQAILGTLGGRRVSEILSKHVQQDMKKELLFLAPGQTLLQTIWEQKQNPNECQVQAAYRELNEKYLEVVGQSKGFRARLQNRQKNLVKRELSQLLNCSLSENEFFSLSEILKLSLPPKQKAKLLQRAFDHGLINADAEDVDKAIASLKVETTSNSSPSLISRASGLFKRIQSPSTEQKPSQSLPTRFKNWIAYQKAKPFLNKIPALSENNENIEAVKSAIFDQACNLTEDDLVRTQFFEKLLILYPNLTTFIQDLKNTLDNFSSAAKVMTLPSDDPQQGRWYEFLNKGDCSLKKLSAEQQQKIEQLFHEKFEQFLRSLSEGTKITTHLSFEGMVAQTKPQLLSDKYKGENKEAINDWAAHTQGVEAITNTFGRRANEIKLVEESPSKDKKEQSPPLMSGLTEGESYEGQLCNVYILSKTLKDVYLKNPEEDPTVIQKMIDNFLLRGTIEFNPNRAISLLASLVDHEKFGIVDSPENASCTITIKEGSIACVITGMFELKTLEDTGIKIESVRYTRSLEMTFDHREDTSWSEKLETVASK